MSSAGVNAFVQSISNEKPIGVVLHTEHSDVLSHSYVTPGARSGVLYGVPWYKHRMAVILGAVVALLITVFVALVSSRSPAIIDYREKTVDGRMRVVEVLSMRRALVYAFVLSGLILAVTAGTLYWFKNRTASQ